MLALALYASPQALVHEVQQYRQNRQEDHADKA